MAIGKHAKRCGIVLAALMSLGAVSAQAAAPYETYSYSYEGDVQISPNAFTPEVKIAQFGEGEVFAEPGGYDRRQPQPGDRRRQGEQRDCHRTRTLNCAHHRRLHR